MKNKVTKAIILGAGFSKRMKLKVPKQLARIDNKPVLAYALDVFERCKSIDGIILVCHRRIERPCRNLIKRYGYKKIEQICSGGATRQRSVFSALRKIKHCDYIVIHDGVRPFVTGEIILKVLAAASIYGAATTAVRVQDTVVETKGDYIAKTLDRNKLWQIQTPQAFKFGLLIQAHQRARRNKIFASTDDAQLVHKYENNKVKIVQSSYKNIKITTPFDLYLARLILQKK